MMQRISDQIRVECAVANNVPIADVPRYGSCFEQQFITQHLDDVDSWETMGATTQNFDGALVTIVPTFITTHYDTMNAHGECDMHAFQTQPPPAA